LVGLPPNGVKKPGESDDTSDIRDPMGPHRDHARTPLERLQAGTCTTGGVATLAADGIANPPALMAAAQRYLRAVSTSTRARRPSRYSAYRGPPMGATAHRRSASQAGTSYGRRGVRRSSSSALTVFYGASQGLASAHQSWLLRARSSVGKPGRRSRPLSRAGRRPCPRFPPFPKRSAGRSERQLPGPSASQPLSPSE
jgi:hypothetical protein